MTTVRLRWPFRKKSNPAYRTILAGLFAQNPIWTKKDIARITEAGFQNCSDVYACVTERSRSAAGVPWQLFQKPTSKGGKKVLLEDHALINLMRRPNPMEGKAAFIERVLAFYLISGNSYLTRVGPDDPEAPPKEMYSIRPDRMKVLPGNDFNPVRGYRYTAEGRIRKPDFTFEEILHLKTFSPLDDWYGLSPINVVSKEIDILGMSREGNMKLLQNDCRPSGGLVVENTLDEEPRKNLEKQLEEKYQGYKNSGRPMVLEGGVRWEPWGLTPKDMDGINTDKVNSRKICSVYNMPPEIIGHEESKTYNSYPEARKALYIEAILPDLDMLADELNNWLTPAFGDNLILEYNKDAIEALREEQTAVYERQAKAWWRTINERRLACGDDEIGKEGDQIFIPSNVIPLTDIVGNTEEE